MTAEQFRKDTESRDELFRGLSIPSVQQALALIKAEAEETVIPMGLAPLDYGRASEAKTAPATLVAKLFELTQPWPDDGPGEPPMTFGTRHTAEEFDQASA